MNYVWLQVFEEHSQMNLTQRREEATLLSSADAQQASRGANDNYPNYVWEQMAAGSKQFILRGTLKQNR